MSLQTDFQKIKKHSEAQGLLWIPVKDAGHYKILNTRDKTKRIVIVGGTIHKTGDTRLIDNIIRQLRMAGYDPDYKKAEPVKKPIIIHKEPEPEPEPIKLIEPEPIQSLTINALADLTRTTDEILNLLIKLQLEYSSLKDIEAKWNALTGMYKSNV